MMASAAPYIGVIDADLQYDEGVLPQMLHKIKEDMNVVIGSRRMSGVWATVLKSGLS